MLSLQAWVGLGAMAIKGYSAFLKTPALLKSHYQIILCHIRTLVGGVLPNFFYKLFLHSHSDWIKQCRYNCYTYFYQLENIGDRILSLGAFGYSFILNRQRSLEDADCIPFRGVRMPTKKKKTGCPEYDTKLYLMVRLQFRISGKWGVRFHCHYSQVHSVRSGSTC